MNWAALPVRCSRQIRPRVGGATRPPEWFILLMVLPLISLLSACTGEPDRSLLTDTPCAAPCWHNLTPGQSTKDDVRVALDSSPHVRAGTLEYAPEDPQGWPAYFAWRPQGDLSSREYVNRIYLREGRVSRIEVYLGYDLTLGEVVARFGPPEAVHASLTTGEFWGYIVVFDYPSKGLTFTSATDLHNYTDVVVAEGTALLSEDLTVTRVDYYAPSLLRHALADVFRYPPALVDEILRDVQPWHGFGTVALADRERW